MWCELADLEEVEAERLDLSQDAVECRPVQEASEHGVGAAPLRRQGWERKQHRGAEMAVDPDGIRDRRWVHKAMVGCSQVNAHHQDQVTAVLTRETCRQQPQLARTLHCR